MRRTYPASSPLDGHALLDALRMRAAAVGGPVPDMRVVDYETGTYTRAGQTHRYFGIVVEFEFDGTDDAALVTIIGLLPP